MENYEEDNQGIFINLIVGSTVKQLALLQPTIAQIRDRITAEFPELTTFSLKADTGLVSTDADLRNAINSARALGSTVLTITTADPIDTLISNLVKAQIKEAVPAIKDLANSEVSSQFTLMSESITVHQDIMCNECKAVPIIGTRFKCTECSEYNLCEMCEESGVHDHHVLLKMYQPEKEKTDDEKKKKGANFDVTTEDIMAQKKMVKEGVVKFKVGYDKPAEIRNNYYNGERNPGQFFYGYNKSQKSKGGKVRNFFRSIKNSLERKYYYPQSCYNYYNQQQCE